MIGAVSRWGRRWLWPEQFPLGVRFGLLVMVVLGAGLLWFGLEGDAADLWGPHPFLTNFLTGLTGAFFGVPFAAVVVSQFQRLLEARSEIRSARELVRRTCISLRASASLLLDDADGGLARELRALDEGGAASGRRPGAFPTYTELGALLERVREADTATARALAALARALPTREAVRQTWRDMQVRWRVVQETALTTLAEEPDADLTGPPMSSLGGLFSEPDPPVLALVELRDEWLPTHRDAVAAVRAPNAVYDGPDATRAALLDALADAETATAAAVTDALADLRAMRGLHDALGVLATLTAAPPQR